ncbi:MAG: DUF1848 domain-containing protein, partial [Caldilineaceae bacterium]|nr:DUF1848 domain-containing protein [Caldilineaceae bacterium]
MIISASRRTDIPAFYAQWFMNRIDAGFCTVPNPFNPTQVAVLSLRPEDVDAIVFWTRNPRPLLPHLPELDPRGFRYYFQFTLMDNPRLLDPKTPPVDVSIKTFRELAERLGPERVIWRYDPIVLSEATDTVFHRARFAAIAAQLRGYTVRSVISMVDLYRKATRRLQALSAQGITVAQDAGSWPGFEDFIRALVGEAADNGIELTSCAEELDLAPHGVRPGQCVDGELIRRLFGLDLKLKKDPGQRAACGCVVSRDIGMYDS